MCRCLQNLVYSKNTNKKSSYFLPGIFKVSLHFFKVENFYYFKERDDNKNKTDTWNCKNYAITKFTALKRESQKKKQKNISTNPNFKSPV